MGWLSNIKCNVIRLSEVRRLGEEQKGLNSSHPLYWRGEPQGQSIDQSGHTPGGASPYSSYDAIPRGSPGLVSMPARSHSKYLMAGSIHVLKPQTPWAFLRPPPLEIISYRNNPVNMVTFWVECHIPIQRGLPFTDWAGNRRRISPA